MINRLRKWVGLKGCGSLLFIVFLVVGCGTDAPKKSGPKFNFPEYPPTKPFLLRQEQVRKRAAEIKRRNEIEIRLNIIKGRDKFYRAWAPLYYRALFAQLTRIAATSEKTTPPSK